MIKQAAVELAVGSIAAPIPTRSPDPDSEEFKFKFKVEETSDRPGVGCVSQ